MCEAEDQVYDLEEQIRELEAQLQAAEEELNSGKEEDDSFVVNVCSWCFNEFRGAYGTHYCSSACEEGRGPKGSWELYWHRLHPGTKEPTVWMEAVA